MPPLKGPIADGTESPLVKALTDELGRLEMDAVVVRGYLGPSGLSTPIRGAVDALPAGPDRDAVEAGLPKWRIYLSPRLDRFVEFAGADVKAYEEKEGVYTVWLRNQDYVVTTVQPLRTRTGFLRGELVEDYMNRPESQQAGWHDQDRGVPTYISRNTCGG